MAEYIRTIAQNKKAYHEYFIENKYEAGIELCGTEVKSIRAGKVNLKDSWCSIVDNEIFINAIIFLKIFLKKLSSLNSTSSLHSEFSVTSSTCISLF